MKKLICRIPWVLWMWLVKRQWKPFPWIFIELDDEYGQRIQARMARRTVYIARKHPTIWGHPEWMMKLYLKSIESIEDI